MLDVEAADVCWLPIGAVGSTASTAAPVGVERFRSACPQAADLRRGRNRRRTRHPARGRSHARSAAAPALPRARDRRAASRRSVPRARRGPAAAARACASGGFFSAATRCPAATDSTISSSKTSPITGCSRSCTSRRKPPPAASRSIGMCVDDDPATRAIFEEILRDEVFHMNYSYTQLGRLSPELQRRHVWRARGSRLWKRYLRVAAAIAGLIGNTLLTGVYFVLLPPFAWVATPCGAARAARLAPIAPDRAASPTSQY